MDRTVPRRTALAIGGAGVVGVAAAACGSSGNGDSAKPPATGVELATLADIPVGEAIASKAEKNVLVAQPMEGKAVAFDNTCTHMGCAVKPAGTELHCPCHGSKYAAKDGSVIHGPAKKPLARVDVHVAGGKVISGKG